MSDLMTLVRAGATLDAASTLLTAADGINPATLPAGLPVYMGYGNGNWPDYEAIAQAHPDATVVDFSVYLANLGNAGDFERGDMTPDQAPTYVRWRLAAGVYRPIAYGSIGDTVNGMPAVVARLTAAGLQWPRDYRRLSAHYGAGKHICGPNTCGSPIQCDGTQWENTPGYDLSVLAADFLGPIARPTPAIPGVSAVVGIAGAGQLGYWLAESSGRVVNFGRSAAAAPVTGNLNRPVVGIAAAPGGGFWLVAGDGGIFPGAGAPLFGSEAGEPLNQPVVGIAANPAADGYWLAAADGGVFNFGAPLFGSEAGHPMNKPVVGIAATPGGDGYWLAGADGGVFPFGAAKMMGESLAAIRLSAPIVGIAARPQGDGYWMVGADGGVFTFGAAPYLGSTGGLRLNQPVSGMAVTPSGNGYWLAARDGGVFNFGDAPFFGSAA